MIGVRGIGMESERLYYCWRVNVSLFMTKAGPSHLYIVNANLTGLPKSWQLSAFRYQFLASDKERKLVDK